MIDSATTFEIRQYRGEAERHSHDHHQVVLPFRGGLDMEIGGQTGTVADTKAALIPAGQDHSFAGSSDNALLVVDIAQRPPAGVRIDRRIWDAAMERPFVGLDPALGGLCTFLVGEVERDGFAGAQALLAGDLLIGALLRRMDLAQATLEGPLVKAIEFIETRFAQPISVEHVARAAGMSVSRFHALFRKRFEMTPKRYIAACRLRHAARLLSESDRSIIEVALAVGYGDQSAFTRAFRRDLGAPPAAYRLAAREQEKRHKIR